MRKAQALRVVVVSPNASTRFGGESHLPWNYFRLLFARGVDVHLVTHSRVKDELVAILPDAADRMHFTVDRALSRLIGRIGSPFPRTVNEMVTYPLMGLIAGIDQLNTIRKLTSGSLTCVVHEPAPVSPRQPSLLSSVGAPVIIGPLNGGMEYPPAFASQVKWYESMIRRTLRLASDMMNIVFRGKINANMILVANERTRNVLPRGVKRERVAYMPENGVDENIFRSLDKTKSRSQSFLYIGRLVDWKKVEILIDALALLPEEFLLEIVGEGPTRIDLEMHAKARGVQSRVIFRGLLSQGECAEALARSTALVLPSIYECGGAVVLEAMAMATPVIATKWGGPIDYISDGKTGILIDPVGQEEMAKSFAEAMRFLAGDSERASSMGNLAREHVRQNFMWEKKIDAMLAAYDRVVDQSACAAEAHA